MHRPRALGVALAAMLAMSVLTASGANAANFIAGNGTGTATIKASAAVDHEHNFLAGSGTSEAKFTIEQDPYVAEKYEEFQVLNTEVGTLECKKVHAEDTAYGTIRTVTLEGIEYTKCHLGGVTATPTVNGCKYTITSSGEFAIGSPTCSLEFSSAGCKLTVPGGQSFPKGSLSYADLQESGKPHELTAEVALEGFKYSWSGSTCGSGSASTGVYHGKLRAKAFTTGATQEDLFLEQELSTPQVLTTFEAGPLLECKEMQLNGTASATAEEVELGSELESGYYGSCVDANYFKSPVTANLGGCHYVMNSNGAVDLGPLGCHITFNELSRQCTVSVGSQSFPAKSVTYTNIQEVGRPKEVVAHMSLAKLVYNISGYVCGEGSYNNGAYDGTFRLKAFTAGGAQEDLEVK